MHWPQQSATRIDRSSRVIGYLCSRIEAGALGPGSRIPCESELAATLGVRVGHVRQAIASLATLGVLRQYPGAGMVLAEGPPQPLLQLLSALHASKPQELTEAHCLLATQLAGLAAERATQDDHTAMAEEVAEMYAAATPGDLVEPVLRFHQRMARSAGNSLLAAFAESLLLPLSGEAGNNGETAFNVRESARTHSEIYRAIRRRQPEEAKKAMEAHLRLAHRDWPRPPETAAAEEEELQRRTAT